MNDIKKLFEEWANNGGCPALLYDDNGHWAVAFDGIQSVHSGKGKEFVSTSFWVDADQWFDSIDEAIKNAIKLQAELNNEP